MEEATVRITVTVISIGEQLSITTPVNETVEHVIQQVMTRAEISEDSASFLLVYSAEDVILEKALTISSYEPYLSKLELKRSMKSKLNSLYGWKLPGNVVEWASSPATGEDNSPPALMDAFSVPSPSALHEPQELGLWEIAKQMGEGVRVISLSQQCVKDLLVPHAVFHLPGDKEMLNISAFKTAVATDLQVSPADIVILAVQNGGSFFVKLTLRPKEKNLSESNSFKTKLQVYVTNINDDVKDKYQNLKNYVSSFVSISKELTSSQFDASFQTPKEKEMYNFENHAAVIEMTEVLNINDERAQLWMKEKETELEQSILQNLRKCEIEYVVQDVSLILNEQLWDQFNQRAKGQRARLLFHGTSPKNYSSIFEKGFIHKGKLDAGYYGKGYYFTSFAEYALTYSHQSSAISRDKPVTLVASYVALGRSYEVKELNQFYGKEELKKGYDSHYVRVVGPHFHPLAEHPQNSEKHSVYDEFVVTESWRVLPRYIITLRPVKKTFIWRDPKVYNEENQELYQALKYKGGFNIYLTTTTAEVINFIKKKQAHSHIFVITNGADDGEGLVDKLRVDLACDHHVLVFCLNVAYHRTWASKYSEVTVTNQGDEVHKWFAEKIL